MTQEQLADVDTILNLIYVLLAFGILFATAIVQEGGDLTINTGVATITRRGDRVILDYATINPIPPDTFSVYSPSAGTFQLRP